ncbi:MAG: DUF4215 domain-containing protein, partial [Myxococcota bacterium]|nr:DUF4215 domain-containing protein [Myxococcota bacterium]
MRLGSAAWVAVVVALPCGACDEVGNEPRGAIALALSGEDLGDDIVNADIRLYAFRLPGAFCDGYRLAGTSGPPVLSTGLTWPQSQVTVAPGDWLFNVRAGNLRAGGAEPQFPLVDAPNDGKYLAEGCIERRGIAAGSAPTVTVVVHDRRPEYCGDGVPDPGEECDDGNTAPGDGCDAECRREAGDCGDGTLGPLELCDDGNTTPGDGCDASCATEVFRVNSTTRELQHEARIAAWADGAGGAGAFVVVFADRLSTDVRFRFFTEAGRPGLNPSGGTSDYPVNTLTTAGRQGDPAIGWGSNGLLAAITHFASGGATLPDIYVVAYDAGRRWLGRETVATTETASRQEAPVVAAHRLRPDHAMAWTSGASGSRIVAFRLFGPDGNAISPADVRADPAAVGDQFSPAAAMSHAGAFALAWVQAGGDGAETGIRLARFAADGTPSGSVATANTAVEGNQAYPSLAFDDTGRLLAAWNDAGTGSVRGRLFDAAGAPVGADFQISGGGLAPGLPESRLVVTGVAAAGGTFIVTWSQPSGEIVARLIAADSTASPRFVTNRVTRDDGPFAAAPPPG